MRRRSYLAATGAALSALAAGCTGRGRVGTDSPTTTESTTEATATTQTTDPPAVTVDEVTLQPAVVHLQTDYLTVYDDGQYLFVETSVESGTVDRSELAVRLGGERYHPFSERRARRLWRLYGEDGWVPETGGLLAFELPERTGSPDAEAVLEHPGGERELAAGLRERLAADPSLTHEFTVPDEVGERDDVPVEVSVQNDGDVPARFVAGLNRVGPRVASMPVEGLTPLVAPGDRAVVELSSDAPSKTPSEDVGDGEWDVRFTLNTVDASAARNVRVVESE